jgi:hypothetical protein
MWGQTVSRRYLKLMHGCIVRGLVVVRDEPCNACMMRTTCVGADSASSNNALRIALWSCCALKSTKPGMTGVDSCGLLTSLHACEI